MRLSQLGEFGMINRIHQIVDKPSGRILLGLGDDSAIIQPRMGWEILVTTDALVENVHFDFSYTPFSSLGWKALAISVSDIASMGGLPLCCVISLAIPETIQIEDVESFFLELNHCARRTACPLIGGDTVASKASFFISVTVIGEVESGLAVKRSGAKPGDLLCMTGQIGASRVGFDILTQKYDRSRFDYSVKRFLKPKPKVDEARNLIQKLEVTSMIDISDGLSSEINHLCRESHVGCILWEDRIPISEDAIHWTELSGLNTTQYVLESGEEYELLFTIDREHFNKWKKDGDRDTSVEFSVIGEMVSHKETIFINSQGNQLPLNVKGWDHFKA